MTEFTIYAPDLARLTHNALAFMPARSAVKVCRMYADQGTLAITATDLFTIGTDSSPIHATPAGVLPSAALIDLSREDLQSLDKAARAAKKEDVQILINHEDGMHVWTVEEDEPLSFLDASAQRQPEDLWERCEELLTLLEGAEYQKPYVLTIDPKFFAPFGKIKPSNGKECIADLFVQSASEPILVKIGATFRGAIMPVDREEAKASEGIGPEGLFDASKIAS